MLCFVGHKVCGILAPQPGIEPTHPALEREVLTSGSTLSPCAFLLNVIPCSH